MPNALTLEIMSPGLLKVGGTRNPEPHRRKSRMREIRSSRSGEGLGWATSQPTLQRPFPPAACAHPVPCPQPSPVGAEGWGRPARPASHATGSHPRLTGTRGEPLASTRRRRQQASAAGHGPDGA